MRERVPGARWTRPEGIHLTLKFLGEAPESRLDEITGVLRGASEGIAPFRLETCGAALFPARGAPRLVWVETRGDLGAARRLAAAIDAATSRIGFPAEAREFQAHLTLGRFKDPVRGEWNTMLEGVAKEAAGVFEVLEYVLFQSRLGPGGSVYTALQRFPLEGHAPGVPGLGGER